MKREVRVGEVRTDGLTRMEVFIVGNDTYLDIDEYCLHREDWRRKGQIILDSHRLDMLMSLLRKAKKELKP